MENKEKKVQQINIELDEKISSGEYANFVVVTHSPAEFVMDFIQVMPGARILIMVTIILIAPMIEEIPAICKQNTNKHLQ